MHVYGNFVVWYSRNCTSCSDRGNNNCTLIKAFSDQKEKIHIVADHWAQIKNNSLVSTALAINACRIAGRLRSLPLLEVNRRRSFSIHGVVRTFSTRSDEQEWHFSCSFMSFAIFSVHRKNKTFRAGRSSLPDYTLIVLKILKPLSAVLIMTPGNCRCQWTSFTSFWPWNKTRKKWATFKKRGKCPKRCPEEKIYEKTKEEISIGVTFSMSIHLTTPEFPSRSPTLVPWGYSALVVDSTYTCQSSIFCVFEDVPESQGMAIPLRD